jgi:hypothetical protein
MTDADRVKAAFAGLPSLPVLQMDEATTLKVGAVVRPAEPGGPHRGFLVVGKPTEEGQQRELFAIEADRATLESLKLQLQDAIDELRGLDTGRQARRNGKGMEL